METSSSILLSSSMKERSAKEGKRKRDSRIGERGERREVMIRAAERREPNSRGGHSVYVRVC